MPVEVRIIEDRIPSLVAKVNATARAGVKRNADRIAITMRLFAPKDTGEMAGSIESKSDVAGYEAHVEIGVDYWKFPNYGTRYQAAQPFVEPAVDQHLHELPEEIFVVLEGG